MNPEFEQGLQNRRRVLGDAWVDKALANTDSFNADFQDLVTRHAWRDIWGRPGLTEKTRRFMVLSSLIALGAWDEFSMHVRAALQAHAESGLSVDELKEVILQSAIYCGLPKANHAMGLAKVVLADMADSR